ncbi:MAG: hypothetical protein J5830_04685, partial [Clostridia bacterium]|nr:hypothetical protein [Clostridia bacterium]
MKTKHKHAFAVISVAISLIMLSQICFAEWCETSSLLTEDSNVQIEDCIFESENPGLLDFINGNNNRTSNNFYITEMDDGYMLTYVSVGSFSKTRYNLNGSNSVRQWYFTQNADGSYSVNPYNNITLFLTVDPSSKNVSLSPPINQYAQY